MAATSHSRGHPILLSFAVGFGFMKTPENLLVSVAATGPALSAEASRRLKATMPALEQLKEPPAPAVATALRLVM